MNHVIQFEDLPPRPADVTRIPVVMMNAILEAPSRGIPMWTQCRYRNAFGVFGPWDYPNHELFDKVALASRSPWEDQK